jgi:riboflavin synthase
VFTGIVQAVGRVEFFGNGRLEISAPDDFVISELGESIAVNGVCLTVVSAENELWFDLSEETIRRSSFAHLKPGMRVNLERAATLATLFGGHIVQGHVDCTGEVLSVTHEEHSTVIRFQAPAEDDRYLIDKGSITVDGISLTVVEPASGAFDTWIIPHTLEHTNLRDRKCGDLVNLEFDVIAKHVDKLLAYRNRG